MAYKALYRTYRPQTFEEVAGQQHIVKTLKNALKTKKIAHAYLFAGPRGTGKTTMAKLLAKALNCEEEFGHQCNVCKNCTAIIEGNHPDVLELDAASNNGVEDIRDLIDKVKYGAILGRYKVYIIDEVHMLSTGAFNALLKTLEEPPEHVIFILATTEPHKILPTILSRCQRYDFSKLSDNEIKQRIKEILVKEQIEYNENAIDCIISLADGGMRDALSILDQVLAYSGDKLNYEDVLNIFALESKDEMISLLKALGTGNFKDVVNKINNYISRGSDIKRLTSDLLDILKDLLIFEESNTDTYLSKISLEEAKMLSSFISNKSCLEMIDILLNSIKEFKSVSSVNTLFEVTILKLVSKNTSNVIDLQEPFNVKDEIKTPVINKVEIKNEPKIEEVKTDNYFGKDCIELSDDIIVLKESDIEDPLYFKISKDTLIKIITVSVKANKTKLLETWDNIKKLLPHPTLGKAAGLIADGHVLVVSDKIMIVEHPFERNVELINNKNNQKDLQNVIFAISGKKIFIYAVNRSDSVDLQNEYLQRKQIDTLPKKEDIILEFEGE